MPDDDQSLEDTLRAAMREYLAQPGRSQAKLAELLGWTQPTVHEIVREKRPRRIKLDEAKEIADAVGVPLASLLAVEPPRDAAHREALDVGSRLGKEMMDLVKAASAVQVSYDRLAELKASGHFSGRAWGAFRRRRLNGLEANKWLPSLRDMLSNLVETNKQLMKGPDNG